MVLKINDSLIQPDTAYDAWNAELTGIEDVSNHSTSNYLVHFKWEKNWNSIDAFCWKIRLFLISRVGSIGRRSDSTTRTCKLWRIQYFITFEYGGLILFCRESLRDVASWSSLSWVLLGWSPHFALATFWFIAKLQIKRSLRKEIGDAAFKLQYPHYSPHNPRPDQARISALETQWVRTSAVGKQQLLVKFNH